jgi:hypothetical protein
LQRSDNAPCFILSKASKSKRHMSIFHVCTNSLELGLHHASQTLSSKILSDWLAQFLLPTKMDGAVRLNFYVFFGKNRLNSPFKIPCNVVFIWTFYTQLINFSDKHIIGIFSLSYVAAYDLPSSLLFFC